MKSEFPYIFLQILIGSQILYDQILDSVIAQLLVHPDTCYILVEEGKDIIINVEMFKPKPIDYIKFECGLWGN